jgi:hypothetical protein
LKEKAQFLLFQDAMSFFLRAHDAEENIINCHRLISGLKHALDMNYARVLDAARNEWERSFAGKDPSDACVSVRITSGDSEKIALPCGGMLKKPSQSLRNGNRRHLLRRSIGAE